MSLDPTVILISLLTIIGITGGVVIGVLGFSYIFILWLRNRNRESISLNSTLLQITVPRDSEIKIDAAEQLFSSLASIRRIWSGDRLAFFKAQPHLSFEVVGLPGDIRFYMHVPNAYRDFVEKQINGSYPDAEILQVTDSAAKQREGSILGTEYNIFTNDGKVAFSTLTLKSADYNPIKSYKDLP
ncbi:hypothetical protein HZC32_01045, partial [Candidatus Woesearchaeota archaeon]|nr:hypothetical protein [Candidatus Woesearchaeota archaeon]